MAKLMLTALLDVRLLDGTDPEAVRRYLLAELEATFSGGRRTIPGGRINGVEGEAVWASGAISTAHLELTTPYDKVVVESDFNGWKMRTESEAWKLQGLLEHMLAQGYKIISVGRAED